MIEEARRLQEENEVCIEGLQAAPGTASAGLVGAACGQLLAVVESGFGSLEPFNRLIRSIFVDARATNLESLVVASSETTFKELQELKQQQRKLEQGIRALAERMPLLADLEA